jgi:hypothetical protein
MHENPTMSDHPEEEDKTADGRGFTQMIKELC